MKTINRLNYIVMALPVLFGLIGLFKYNFYFISLLLFIPLGIFQLSVALWYNYHLKDIKDIHLKIYGYAVMIFFSFFFTIEFWWDVIEPLGMILCFIPPTLAIYFSIIIYKKQAL